ATSEGVDARVRPLSEGVALLRGAGTVAVDRGAMLIDGDRVLTAQGGRASIGLSTGTNVVVEGSSEVSLVARSSGLLAFSVGAGALHADVAKLGAGERFVIRTPDAEIEVRGTSFRVSL